MIALAGGSQWVPGGLGAASGSTPEPNGGKPGGGPSARALEGVAEVEAGVACGSAGEESTPGVAGGVSES